MHTIITLYVKFKKKCFLLFDFQSKETQNHSFLKHIIYLELNFNIIKYKTFKYFLRFYIHQ